MVDLKKGEIVFISPGMIERYVGRRNAAAIRRKKSREKLAKVWYQPNPKGGYYLLDTSLSMTGHMREIDQARIRTKASAVLGAMQRRREGAEK